MRGLFAQILTLASLAGTASAAPWVRDDDGWYARALIAHDTLGDAEGWRADAYGEYGLTGDWTLTAKAESVTYPGYETFDREAYRITLRRKLLARGHWALGAEAGPVYGSTSTGFTDCSGLGFEARAGLGYSNARQGRPYYLFADAAYIQQDNGCERARVEIGYGSDLSRHIFLTQQVWLEDGNQTADSIKIENQIGVHFDLVDVSLGYREELGGQFDEHAVLVALVARH
ncbi:MAG: hypothetical protein FP825_02670 [Hyphomonas sp.]|uniref:hypothetical protein n=1 Tax=Hyphomonas sp. TaxID=87 RepID=UPI00180AD548|nr:hypothetical protein [Hyphomonas sp.]MBA3067368.1 hypothetical protein [Hyphomonas sp.]MBU4063057.1 hypothetical protein [Alphaproteobacteria bacterium]MBU4163638.1 hypothetical protein [Alphaproteobacteria bacterium]